MNLDRGFPFTLEDDINFWSQQLGEHCLFVSSGLAPGETVPDVDKTTIQDYKNTGLKLNYLWNEFREKFINKIFDEKQLISLIDNTEEYQNSLLKHLTTVSGSWIGYVPVSLLEHHLEELLYFKGKINGQYDESVEIKYWNDINKDHITLEMKFLDPKEKESAELAKNFVDDYESIELINDVFNLLDKSYDITLKLDDFNLGNLEKMTQGKLLSIIHPLLLKHIIREEQRSIDALQIIMNDTK